MLHDGGGHDTPPSTGTGATTEASASTMELPTSTGDTDARDITRGEVPDCGMIAEAPACKSMVGCLWDDLGGICVSDCAMNDDDMAAYCEWYDGHCYPPI